MQQDAVRLERAERRFRRDIWSVAPADAVVEAGVRMHWFGRVLASVFAYMPGAAVFNLIQGAAEPGATSQGELEAAVEWASSWEVDYMVAVAAGRPETELAEEWLQWRGYEQRLVVKRNVRAATAPEPSEAPYVTVRRLPREEDETIACLAGKGMGLPDMAEILFIALPCLPHWRCYVADLDGEVVATGSMMISEGVATLGIDATLPHARGCGCSRALMERRLADAAAMGCHTVQAFSSEQLGEEGSRATRGLRRFGFEEVGRIVSWGMPVRH
jgi:GNAT superfamily N-acetyltransferase